MSKVNCKAWYAFWGYYLEFNWKEWNRSVYLKSDAYEEFKAYLYSWKWAIDNTDNPTILDHAEWSIAISSIIALNRKSVSWKMMSFIESIGWDEKVMNARKSVFWQLFERN